MNRSCVALVVLLSIALAGGCTPGTGAPTATPSASVSGQGTLRITTTAGPTCPVETTPPDPACAPRPVLGAVLLARDARGAEVARQTTDASGVAHFLLAAGSYTIEALPAEGYLGTPAALDVALAAGATVPLDLAYDTGIR